MNTNCPRCKGKLLHFLGGALACINCGHEVEAAYHLGAKKKETHEEIAYPPTNWNADKSKLLD